MVELKNIDELNKLDINLVVNIGNYDGVHSGHRQLINFLKNEANDKGCALCLFTFKPHPRVYFENVDNFLLSSDQSKKEDLAQLGVDYLLELDFLTVSELSAQDFLKKYIQSIKSIKSLFLGYDFRFGKDKKGDFILANNVLKDNAIDLYKSPEFKLNALTPSSSKIRDSLIMGDILKANELLTRAYSITGEVIKGLGKGKQIGVPTINLNIPSQYLIPKKGVYFTKTYIQGLQYYSITNIGINPTFGKLHKTSVETHVFDFDCDVYGQEVKIDFFHYQRAEKKFENVKMLIDQISSDIELAKKYWS